MYKGKRRKAWGIRYSIDGAKFIRTIVADAREAAEDKLDRRREEYREQQRTTQSGLTDGKTFTDLVKPFLEFKEQLGPEMVTIRCPEYKLQPCKTHQDGERCPECDQRIDKATVSRDLAMLRTMRRLAVCKWRWLDREPYLERLPEKPGRDLELSEAEEERLLAVCSPALAELIAGAIHTRMRQGELIGLT
jgi:hypothetical protein